MGAVVQTHEGYRLMTRLAKKGKVSVSNLAIIPQMKDEETKEMQ